MAVSAVKVIVADFLMKTGFCFLGEDASTEWYSIF